MPGLKGLFKSKKNEKLPTIASGIAASTSVSIASSAPQSRFSFANSSRVSVAGTTDISTPDQGGGDSDQGDQEVLQSQFVQFGIVKNGGTWVTERVPDDGNWPRSAENQHVRWNIESVNQFIGLVRDTTPSLGRKLISFWFRSNRPLPAHIYQRSLSELALGHPLWEPCGIYRDKHASKQDRVRIGAIGASKEDGMFQVVQSYDADTERWDKEVEQEITEYDRGYILRSKAYTIDKTNTFWSQEDPPAGGILFLRAPLVSKDAGKEVRNKVRIRALSYVSAPLSPKVREHNKPYYITGYDSTKSCVMAVHHSLHKVGFTFKQKNSPQNKNMRTLAWRDWYGKEQDIPSKSDKVQTAGGVQTVCHSFEHERSIFVRGYRVAIRPNYKVRSFQPDSVRSRCERELDECLVLGNIKLEVLWGKASKGEKEDQIIRVNSQGEIITESANRLRGGANVHATHGNFTFGAQGVYHPSDLINQYKLILYENATVVATHDDEWTQLLRASDTAMLPGALLIERWIQAAISEQIYPELTVGVDYRQGNQLHTHILSQPFVRRGASPRDIYWDVEIFFPNGESTRVTIGPIQLTPNRLLLPSFQNAIIRWRVQVVAPNGQTITVQGHVTVRSLLDQL